MESIGEAGGSGVGAAAAADCRAKHVIVAAASRMYLMENDPRFTSRISAAEFGERQSRKRR
jgi:hypothetical protein